MNVLVFEMGVLRPQYQWMSHLLWVLLYEEESENTEITGACDQGTVC